MRFFGICAVALLLSGCAWSHGDHEPRTIGGLTFRAVDNLVDDAGVPGNAIFLVGSLANLGDLDQSSDLGRLVSEQAAQRLIQRGFSVPEVRLTETLHVRQGGEFMLSDEVSAIRKAHPADDVLTGTVGRVGDVTYVSLRIIRLSDGVAVAATTFALPSALTYTAAY